MLDVPARGAGTQVDRYRLLEILGTGGSAVVYRARDEVSGRIVALKTVRSTDEALLASIRREIFALGRLIHPGIVRILDGGVFDGQPWYAMELLEGVTLWECTQGHPAPVTRTSHPGLHSMPGPATLAARRAPTLEAPFTAENRPPMPPVMPLGGDLGWFLTLIRRVCEPLAYMHGEGIVHRDLKPTNVFVRADGTPVLMDFGLTWRVHEEGGREVVSVDASRAGTAAYMAPEQALGERMDARADLFSLGCIIYEALTGRLPYPAHSIRDLIATHAAGPPMPPSRLVENVPRGLDALVMGLLERSPPERIGHASDVAAALADMAAEGWPAGSMPRAKAYLYRPQVVGRDPLLQEALGYIDELAAHRGGCVLVGGESGIGKTSFASEVARVATLAGMQVLTGECRTVGVAGGKGMRGGGALYPFVRPLHAIADRCVAGGSEVTERLLGERAKVLAECDPSLRHLPGADGGSAPAEVPGDAARRRLFDALAETLAAFVADTPTLLVLDDLQWADDLTLAFLESLSERYYATNPLLILGTYRSEELGPDLERVLALPHVKRMVLGRLDTKAIAAMASDMLGQKQVAEKLASFLTTESSGNPFFAAEYLRAAVDANMLFRDERGRWSQTGGRAFETLGLPRTLEALVTARLDSLGADTRRLCELAAVVGRDVDIDVLRQLATETGTVADEGKFDEAVQELVVRQVLEPGSAGSLRFVHDKLREIAYARLDDARQHELHRVCGGFLEKWHLAAGTLDRVAAALAHHFEKAGVNDKAVSYLDRAGETAHRTHANQEALKLLERAAVLEAAEGLASSPVARARRGRMLGLNALALGDVRRASEDLIKAAATAGRPWPSSRGGLVARCVLGLGEQIASRWLPDFVQREPPGDEPRELLLEAARAYERLLVVKYFATGDMAAVVLSALTNVNLAERAGGASCELALGYATFAAMCSLVRLDAAAMSYCRRALDAARASGDEVAETWVRMNVALVYLQTCRWSEMRTMLDSVRAMATQMGFSRRWEEATSQYSTACLLGGRFNEAEQLNAELLGSIERADPQAKCWAVVRQAELRLVAGDLAGALESARAGEELCQHNLGRAEQVYALGPVMLARLRAGDARGARDAADRCAEWLRKGSAPVFYNVFACAALVETTLALRDQAADDDERAALTRAARWAGKRLRAMARPMLIAAPRALYWQAMEALRIDGKRERATRLLRKSAERARALDLAYDQAAAAAALAEHGAVGKDEAQQLAAEAAEQFRGMGAVFDAERVERLRSRVS